MAVRVVDRRVSQMSDEEVARRQSESDWERAMNEAAVIEAAMEAVFGERYRRNEGRGRYL
jgi:hypothetical protein